MKKTGYAIFAIMYYICRLFRVKGDKVMCIMTHDPSRGGNVGTVVRALKRSGRLYRFYSIRKEDRGRPLAFFLVKPYHMATSKYILMDNAFLPMAYMKFPKEVKVVQLWHGTGTVKKFGQDVNRGTELGRLEERANAAITHLVVNSEYTKRQYMGAFGVSEDKVCVLGLPRTDHFFAMRARKKNGGATNRLYRFHPNLVGKKIWLYAPTFRDGETEDPKVRLDIGQMSAGMPDGVVLLLRLHPHVAEAYRDVEWRIFGRENVVDVSDYPNLNHLLYAADALITDYSSIIFEYCLLGRPMYFYAYDLEEFTRSGRGFYEDYESYVPGPVSRGTEELLEQMCTGACGKEEAARFVKDNYDYLDGRSTGRLLREVFG